MPLSLEGLWQRKKSVSVEASVSKERSSLPMPHIWSSHLVCTSAVASPSLADGQTLSLASQQIGFPPLHGGSA